MDDTKHYPNKNEATLLRKLKAKTGLSEEEIRSYRKYRKMLANAQKSGTVSVYSAKERFFRELIKSACKKTGLAKEHPDTLAELNRIIEARFELAWQLPYGIGIFVSDKISAKKTIEYYGK